MLSEKLLAAPKKWEILLYLHLSSNACLEKYKAYWSHEF